MKNKKTRKLASRTLAVTSVLALLLAPATLVSGTPESYEEEPLTLEELAELLNVPVSSLSMIGNNPSCGARGECNYVECPDPGCDPGDSKRCSCTSTGEECGRWFETKRPVYDCECTCYSNSRPPSDPPEPQECTIKIGKVCVQAGGVVLLRHPAVDSVAADVEGVEKPPFLS